MFNLESDEMTGLWPNDILTFTFYMKFSSSIPNSTTSVKEVFGLMLSLESDEMTAWWRNDSLTFTYHVIFANGIPN